MIHCEHLCDGSVHTVRNTYPFHPCDLARIQHGDRRGNAEGVNIRYLYAMKCAYLQIKSVKRSCAPMKYSTAPTLSGPD
jgi:hypothetical protein